MSKDNGKDVAGVEIKAVKLRSYVRVDYFEDGSIKVTGEANPLAARRILIDGVVVLMNAIDDHFGAMISKLSGKESDELTPEVVIETIRSLQVLH